MSSIYKAIMAGVKSASSSDDVRRASLQQHSQYSKAEATRLSDMIQEQPKSPSMSPGTGGIYAYATSVNSSMSKRIEENREILKLMPEVMQTATIHRAAIQAPNDLQITPMNFITDYPLLTDVVRKQVQEVIGREVESYLKLSTKLSGIIHRAIFEVGAECFITLPSSKIDEALNTQVKDRGKTRPLTATESIAVMNKESKSIKSHIITNQLTEDKITNNSSDSSAQLGLECFNRALESSAVTSIMPSRRPNVPDELAKEMAMCVHPNNLLLVDNIDFIRADILKDAVALENIASALVPHSRVASESTFNDPNMSSVFNDKYGPAFITSLDGSNTPNSKKIKGEPVILNCPANSLIPIIKSGYPSSHHGYLYLTDFDGMPFSGDSMGIDRGSMSTIGSSKVTIGSTVMSRNERFSKLNQMMTGQGVLGGDNNDIVVRAIHKETVKAFLQKKLRDGGLRGITIPERNDIYEYLFSNFMAMQPSRIVFIPHQLVTYITLNYNNIDGTGNSALESIKDTLVHLLTLRMARLSAATLNSVHRRTINIAYSPKFRGNHAQVTEALTRAHIERSNMTSTFNPDIIVQDLVRKSLTVKVTGVPGMDGFSAEVQPSESQHSVPDSDLAEDLDKTYKSGLFVPAAATNNLSEAEYSRSVATTNIHYAQVVTDHQLIFCNGITHLVRNMLRYSERARKAIMSVLGSTTDNNDGTISGTETAPIDYDYFVDSIHARLPKPNLPSNNLKLEVIPQAISNIASIVESLYPDTLYAGADSDTFQTMQTIRAHVTQMFVRKLLDDIGSTDSLGGFPTIQDLVLDSDNLTEQRMSVESIQSAISELNKLVTKMKENAGMTESSDTSIDTGSDVSDSGDTSDYSTTTEDTTSDSAEVGDEYNTTKDTNTADDSEEDKTSTAETNKDAFDEVDKLSF